MIGIQSMLSDMVRGAKLIGSLLALAAATSAFAQIPGSLDTSFNVSGKRSVHFTAQDNAYSVAVQPDGKVLLAGRCVDGSNAGRVCLARLLANGALDTTFGGPLGNGAGKFMLTDVDISNDVVPMVLQPDGKIIIVAASFAEFWLARLNANGTMDTTFTGPSGAATGSFYLSMPGGANIATSMMLQQDGKILIGGRCLVSVMSMCMARLLPNGAFDVTFDGPGTAGDGRFAITLPFASEINSVAQQADGKLLFAGRCQTSASTSDSDFCVGRLTLTGAYDATFAVPPGAAGVAGRFSLPIGPGYDSAAAVVVQPDGRILLAGTCTTAADNDFCAVRFNSDGSLDTAFDGPSGAADGKFLLSVGINNDNLNGALLQPDGKAILYGSCAVGAGLDFCVARLNHDGSLDVTFDGPSGVANGKFTLAIYSGIDIASAAALQSDGKLLLAGSCYIPSDDDFCVARLHGGPLAAKQCSLDIDGDGQVTPTRDALIIARISLGITGPAVINGISFASHATRNTWPLIREYLVGQCGQSLP